MEGKVSKELYEATKAALDRAIDEALVERLADEFFIDFAGLSEYDDRIAGVRRLLTALSETHLILPKPVVGEGERDALQDLERCEKASPPPWSVEQRGCHELGYDVEGAEAGIRGQFEREEDAEFCAQSRTSEPYWIRKYLALASTHAIVPLEVMREIGALVRPCEGCPLSNPVCRADGCLEKQVHDVLGSYLPKEASPHA